MFNIITRHPNNYPDKTRWLSRQFTHHCKGGTTGAISTKKQQIATVFSKLSNDDK